MFCNNHLSNAEYLALACEAYPAWGNVLIRLDKDISNIAPSYKIMQIKDKFGTLRFYYDFDIDFEKESYPDDSLIDKIEDLIFKASLVCLEIDKENRKARKCLPGQKSLVL